MGGRSVGHTTICRRYVATDVRTVAVRERGLAGLLFRADTSDALPAVLVLGGSEGGLLFAAQTAALLASHGMVSLALAYFRFEQLPPHLVEIPLEYFETATPGLSAQPGVKPDALAVVGRSRGAELALLLGSRFDPCDRSSLTVRVASPGTDCEETGLRIRRRGPPPGVGFPLPRCPL